MLAALIAKKPYAEAKKRAEYLLDRVGLSNRKDNFPSQLSGGEQQRIAIARALVNNPAILLADEPSGSLDSVNAFSIHELLHSINLDLRTTMIIVTHNTQLASSMHRIIKLQDGRQEN